MKNEHSVRDFIKSKTFRILLAGILLVAIIGIALVYRHKDKVQLKENVLYVAPRPVK